MAREHGSDPGIKSGLKEASASASVNPSEKPLPVEKIDESKIRQALPRSLCRGTLPFGDVECHVLEDGQRVISARGFMRAFAADSSGAKDAHSERRIARILNESEALKVGPRVEFVAQGGKHLGYPAELLVDVCDAYIDGLVDGKLHPKQIPIARRARHIQKAFAKLGIIALVDEVTGFQEQREKNALRLKLSAYLLDVPAEWERMFPPEFYDLLAKLYRVRLSGGQRPHIFAWFTRKFVYEPVLDPDVANALDARNPEPHHGSNHHQHFTENARELVARHLSAVMILLRQSQSFPDFQHRFAVQFSGAPLQFSLPAVA